MLEDFLFYIKDNLLGAIIVTIIVGFLAYICKTIWNNRRWLNIWLQSIYKCKKDVRISYSYLFKIKNKNEKYLLIKGDNIDQYQPIGGVYKYYESFKKIQEDLHLQDDSERQFFENRDLRQITKGRYIPKIIRWFRTCKNREVSVYRELIEELNINSDVVSKFVCDSKVEFLKQIIEPIKFVDHFNMNVQHIYDVYELSLSEEIFKDLLLDKHKYVFVEAEDINRHCFKQNNLLTRIGEHAQYII